ncbi:potassium-transporting ATPase subunit KdpA [Granulicella arctica]|uniref:potassium-transporting ATPase subunit KdpA n=1 Tax=Granulicella arctica TaxID=940613 RepID=UPI0021E06F5F|nr:potassium-transporting ATPase subunit KdpA [Granulicella arctica]
MTANGWFQICFLFALVLVCTKPMGVYMAHVFERERTFADVIFRPIERLLYKVSGIDEAHEMRWTEYATAMLLFSLVTMLATYLIERIQHVLPLNPQQLANVPADLALNTAASFTTNTNWQSYVPEATMSYLTQMLTLAYHNFFSAAVGLALAVAFIRGIARKESKTLGNFWVDTTRASLWVLLPGCVVYALLLVSQGVVQNFRPYDQAKLVQAQTIMTTGADGKSSTQTVTTQSIAQGPVASQEAIKMLGTNGGGFFNANSAHPFENPTPLSNLVQIFSILIIPAGLTVTLGRMTRAPAHGWAVFAAMAALFFVGVFVAYYAEVQANPLLHSAAMHIDQHASPFQAGGNMEGKEVRFGIANSALFATVTTDASCGAVNAMHDSFMPLGGLVPLVNIMLGEVIFGGVGSGLYGMLIFVILAVFIAGLMVGRTPEYLGKKIESFDVKMAMLYTLIFPLSILGFSAITLMMPNVGLASLANGGPHGLSEILYAYTSATGNNGSAFAGLSPNTHWFNLSLAAAMLIGRFLMIVPMLAVAGNLAQKKLVPPSPGTFPVHTALFTILLVGTIVIVGALTFFPALALGPILEHLLLHVGKVY